MGAAVRSSSSSHSARLRAAVAALLLAGCSSAAPPLPPDTTSINRTHDLTINDFTPEAQAMSCGDIADERQKIADAMKGANDAIAGNRTRNEVAAGIFDLGGLVAAPALLASNNNDAEKDQITKLYARRDTLIKLATLKHCPASPPA